MKNGNRFRILFFGMFFYLLMMPIMSAVEIKILHFQCDITLSKSKIISGEPVSLIFSFTYESDGLGSIFLDDSKNTFANINERSETERLKLSIQNTKGNEMPRRNLICHPISQVIILSESNLEPSETVTGEYPLHLRVSTLLEPGEYIVTISAIDILQSHLTPEYLESVGTGPKIYPTSTRESYSVPPLTLEVEPYDEAKLLAVYDALMAEAQYALAHPSGSWQGLDYFDIEAPIRTLLWAYGPVAVPYQIELIYDPEIGFLFWPPAIVHTWDNIVRFATREQVEEVLAFARHPEFEKPANVPFSSRYTPGLVWAIHQWHTHGTEEIKALTKELAEKFPAEDLCPYQMERGVWPYGK